MDACESDGHSSDDAVFNSVDKDENPDSVLLRRLNELAKAKGTLEFQNKVLQRELDANRVDMEDLFKENRLLTRRWTLAIKQSEEVNSDRRSAVEALKKEKSKSRLLEDELWRLRQHQYVTEEEDKLLMENARASDPLTDHQNTTEDLNKNQTEWHALQVELDELKKESFTREEEIKKLRAENVLVTRALTDHQNTVEGIREEKHSLQKKLEELNKQSCTREEEIKVLRGELAHVTRELTDHQNIVKILKTEQSEKHIHQEELDQLKKDCCMGVEEAKMLRAEIENITWTFSDYQNVLEDLRKERNETCKLQEALDVLEKEKCTKDENIEELCTENMRITRALMENQKVTDILKIEQTEKHTLQEELERLKKDICLREEEINKLCAENARVTCALTEHMNEKSELSANFDQASSELTSLLQKYSAQPNRTQPEQKFPVNVPDNHKRHVAMLGDILHQFDLNMRKSEAELKKERNKSRALEGEIRKLRKDVQEMNQENKSENSRLSFVLKEQMNEKYALSAHLNRAAFNLNILVEKYGLTVNSFNAVSITAQRTPDQVHVQETQKDISEDVSQMLHANIATFENLLSQLTCNLQSALEDLKKEQSKSRELNELVHRSKKNDDDDKTRRLNTELWWLQHAFRVGLYNLSQLSFYGPMTNEIGLAVQPIESAILNFQKALFESSESLEVVNKDQAANNHYNP